MNHRASRKGRQGRKEGRELCSEAAMPGFRQAVDDSLDSVLESNFSKADQQTEAPVAQTQLREQLFAVNRDQLFNRLEFHKDLVLDHQVGAETFATFAPFA